MRLEFRAWALGPMSDEKKLEIERMILERIIRTVTNSPEITRLKHDLNNDPRFKDFNFTSHIITRSESDHPSDDLNNEAGADILFCHTVFAETLQEKKERELKDEIQLMLIRCLCKTATYSQNSTEIAEKIMKRVKLDPDRTDYQEIRRRYLDYKRADTRDFAPNSPNNCLIPFKEFAFKLAEKISQPQVDNE